MLPKSVQHSMTQTPVFQMQELRLLVPTYNGILFADQIRLGLKPEFGPPRVSVLVREADGVQVVLGSHDFTDRDAPDIQIERHPRGWSIFLHPAGGGDPTVYVYFLDDGRCFLRNEETHASEDRIVFLRPEDSVPHLEV